MGKRIGRREREREMWFSISYINTKIRNFIGTSQGIVHEVTTVYVNRRPGCPSDEIHGFVARAKIANIAKRSATVPQNVHVRAGGPAPEAPSCDYSHARQFDPLNYTAT